MNFLKVFCGPKIKELRFHLFSFAHKLKWFPHKLFLSYNSKSFFMPFRLSFEKSLPRTWVRHRKTGWWTSSGGYNSTKCRAGCIFWWGVELIVCPSISLEYPCRATVRMGDFCAGEMVTLRMEAHRGVPQRPTLMEIKAVSLCVLSCY